MKYCKENIVSKSCSKDTFKISYKCFQAQKVFYNKQIVNILSTLMYSSFHDIFGKNNTIYVIKY
jgi:hypothetical protein